MGIIDQWTLRTEELVLAPSEELALEELEIGRTDEEV